MSDRPKSVESEFSGGDESEKLLPKRDDRAFQLEGTDLKPDDQMDTGDDPFSTNTFSSVLEKTIKDHSDEFTPILRYFIQNIFCISTEHQQRLNAMYDPVFRRLIDQSPAYQQLTNAELYDCLFDEVETLFEEKSTK